MSKYIINGCCRLHILLKFLSLIKSVSYTFKFSEYENSLIMCKYNVNITKKTY